MPFAKRKRFSQAMRATVAHDQDYQCALCSAKLPVSWHLDHIVPLCDPSWEAQFPGNPDGATRAANCREQLQAVCPNCHCAKSLLEVSEPELAKARPDARPHKIPWEAARLRRRIQIDKIWAFEAGGDKLSECLTGDKIWPQLVAASTEREYRQVYRQAVGRGGVSFATFMARANHLLSA